MHQLKLKTMFSTTLRCAWCSSPLPLHTFKPKNSLSFSSSIQYPQWSGLRNWRESPLNENRFWGPTGPKPPVEEPNEGPAELGGSLAEMGALVLSTADPLTKSNLSHLAYSRWRRERLPIGVFEPPGRPARPPKPQLVSPKEIPSPKSSGLPLNAYMLHNLAHVELNAIDLAWDTVVRFSPYIELLGEGFFADFAHVADDESRHFVWCSQRLAELGFSYGDMPAHNLLWRECDKSSDNVAARLAVIPLVQEARGLDAGPRLVQKLMGFGDHRTSNIVSRIADEEIAHVAVGVYWFISVCQKMDRVPCSTFKGLFPSVSSAYTVHLQDQFHLIHREILFAFEDFFKKRKRKPLPTFLVDLLNEYNVELKGPFNHSARDEAGIPREWYDPSSTNKQDKNEQLSEVYERLACVISMEQDNSSLNTHSG